MPHSYKLEEQQRLSLQQQRKLQHARYRAAVSRQRSQSEQALPSKWTPVLTDTIATPNLELVTLRAIDAREYHLSRLQALLLQGCPIPKDEGDFPGVARALTEAREHLADTLHSLRMAGVEVVEAIMRWRRRRQGRMEPFVWQSHNYLLKMLLDIFFLGLSESLADATSDPFLLNCFAEATKVASNGSRKILNDSGTGMSPSPYAFWPEAAAKGHPPVSPSRQNSPSPHSSSLSNSICVPRPLTAQPLQRLRRTRRSYASSGC